MGHRRNPLDPCRFWVDTIGADDQGEAYVKNLRFSRRGGVAPSEQVGAVRESEYGALSQVLKLGLAALARGRPILHAWRTTRRAPLERIIYTSPPTNGL